MKFLRIFLALGILSVLLLSSGPAQAQQGDKSKADAYALFDEKNSYNIYFSNAESVTIIRSVEILGFKEIAGKLFLIVQPDGFNLNEYDGYILFDSIQAILPDKNYRIE